MLDFPVMDMHVHAWPLYSAAKLIGLEFTAQGAVIKVGLPLDDYRFASPVLGFERSARGYHGWYAPGRSGQWTIVLHFPAQERNRFDRKRVNGVETPLRPAENGSIEIQGESAPGRRLEWSVDS